MSWTSTRTWLEALQSRISNQLDMVALPGKKLCAIIGDTPSTTAKSPSLWNAVFKRLALPAVYLALDVPRDRLGEVVRLLREGEDFLGGSVTMPYKREIIPFLDGTDALTGQVGAVNTLVRSADGKITGHNTDGLAGVRAITEPFGPGERPLLKSLEGKSVCLIGAGGAAQALGFTLAQRIGQGGRITVLNRDGAKARDLSRRLAEFGKVRAEDRSEVEGWRALREADLILNATTKGQAGWRQLPGGKQTCLTPYSALAPADPAVLPAGSVPDEAARRRWLEQSAQDILRNQERSLRLLAERSAPAACYDIIYNPRPTEFLRHAALAGCPTLDGKPMNVWQAVEAFCRFVCPALLAEAGHSEEAADRLVTAAMEEVW